MKLHDTLIEHLLKLMEINSGWKDEWKLRQALQKLEIDVYKQTNGNPVLVEAKALRRETNKQRE